MEKEKEWFVYLGSPPRKVLVEKEVAKRYGYSVGDRTPLTGLLIEEEK